jgi:CheY-like chemotaxis protein
MPDRAKVLLVDDREENLIALEAILSSLDLVPIRARSGEEALKALLATDFALILLDVRMPGMDGFLTVVDSAPDYAFRGYAAGAVDYLTKPFDPWVLRAKVAVFVELYNMNRRLAEQAALLRERLSGELSGGTSDQAAVLPELSRRISAVEEELNRVRDLARKTADTTMEDSLTDLSDRVAHLRAGFDALT